MGLDLGSLIGTVAGSYFNAKYSGGTRPGLPIQTMAGFPPLSTITGIPDSAPLPLTPALGLPFADIVMDAPSAKMVWDPAANCGAGKWLRKRRRRHRNLATRGDIKDLSALKGVLGQGKLLEVWIATHS